ncbi:MAG: hypothetical protein U5K37_06010 [Natrialbaceae archaeon]|nr:hypothetical protein [Natrialbaceae archaeon]
MADQLSREVIDGWIDRTHPMVAEVDLFDEDPVEYNFRVSNGSLAVHVIKEAADSPLLLACRLTMGGELLETVRDGRRDQFFGEITSVLTNTPGTHSFTDEDGQTVDQDAFTTVSLKHWIYPDGASQDELMRSIVDMMTSIAYVKQTASRIHRQVTKHQSGPQASIGWVLVRW